METDVDKFRREIAYHEAAHSLLAYLGGHVLRHVVIDDFGNKDHPNHCSELTLFETGRRWLCRDDVHYILAGIAAHEIQGLDDPFAGCDTDLKIIADLMETPDPETAAMREFLCHHPDVTPREFAGEFLPDIVARLQEPKAQECIKSGADLLLKSNGRVPGRLMAETFLFVYGGSPPEKALPLWMHRPADEPEAPLTQAEALEKLAKAIEQMEKAVDDVRTAFDYENDRAEHLAAKTLQYSFVARDIFQGIETNLPS